MTIYPAIDLLGGTCVRLFQGDYAQSKSYNPDPASQARSFEVEGAEWLHIVDLDGAKAGQPVNLDAIRVIRAAVSCKIQLGGGVRSLESARMLLDLGIDRVIAGSRLASDEAFAQSFFSEFGARAVAGIDARDGLVAVHGWTESSGVRAADLASKLGDMGCQTMIVTDVATDGALQGPNLSFLANMARSTSAAIIASGGVSGLDDLSAISRIQPSIEGAIIGKALYEGRFSLVDAVRHQYS